MPGDFFLITMWWPDNSGAQPLWLEQYKQLKKVPRMVQKGRLFEH